MVPLLRSFIYSDGVVAAIKEAAETWDSEDSIRAIEWAIIHDPEIGILLNESGLRAFVYHGARSINQPDIDVIYGPGNPEFVIHDLVFSEAKAGHAGRA